MSRTLILPLMATVLAAPALAAPQPSRSPAEIVCALTGDCGGAAGGVRPERPAEAAFSFTRPAKQRAATPARARSTAEASPAARARPAASGIDMRIGFALGSAEMTPQGRAEAAQFARALALPQLAERRFVVEGHTDAIGDRAYNLDLSQRRAAAVSAYLVSLGVSANRIEPKGYGFDKPLPGRGAVSAANRRVQFVPAA